YSVDGKRVAVSALAGVGASLGVAVYDISTGEPQRALTSAGGSVVAFGRGDTLATDVGAMADAGSPQPLWESRLSAVLAGAGGFRPDGDVYAIGGSWSDPSFGGAVVLWDAVGGRLSPTVVPPDGRRRRGGGVAAPPEAEIPGPFSGRAVYVPSPD